MQLFTADHSNHSMDDALAEAHRLHAHGRATFDAAALDSAEPVSYTHLTLPTTPYV